MKLIVFKYLIFYLIVHKVILISSKYYRNNDLIMNFSDDFIKKFQDNKNFMRYTNNLIDKVKQRIKEKLINSFILRIEREKNAEEHLKRLYKSDFQNINSSDYYSTDMIQKQLLANNAYLDYLANSNEKSNNYSSINFVLKKFNNTLMTNRTKDNITISIGNRKSKRLISLLNNMKSSKKFIDFTNVFLDSDEEFQSKFNEREILQYIKKLDEIKIRKKIDNRYDSSYALKDDNSTYYRNKKNKLLPIDFLKEIKNNEDKINNYSQIGNKINITFNEEAKEAEKIMEKKRKNKEILSDEIKNLNLINVNYDIPELKAKRRKIKFFIDLENDCNIYINDTVFYENNKELNIIDHLILHNDVENIDPRSISSESREINYFIFNRKLNMFSVKIDDEKENSNKQQDDFEINYEYMADNMIKTRQFVLKENNLTNNLSSSSNKNYSASDFNNKRKFIDNNSFDLNNNENDDEESFWNNIQNSYFFDNNITSYLFGNLKKINKKQFDKNIKKFNDFMWRVNNQNNEENIYLELEFLFALGENFDYNKIKFNFKTTRSTKKIYDKEFQMFSWKGILMPYEVKNIKCAFPLAFETCGNILTYDFSIFMLLSLFIIFIVLIIYLISKIIF